MKAKRHRPRRRVLYEMYRPGGWTSDNGARWSSSRPFRTKRAALRALEGAGAGSGAAVDRLARKAVGGRRGWFVTKGWESKARGEEQNGTNHDA